MKKICIVLISILAIFTAFACNDKGSEKSESASSSIESVESESKDIMLWSEELASTEEETSEEKKIEPFV